MSEQIENMRKRLLTDQPKTPSKKRCISPPSSPLAPLPELQSPSQRTFNRIKGLPFSREIRQDIPQNAFDLFALFCPDYMVEDWSRYVNIRCDEPTWRPTFKEEMYLFFGVLLYMSFDQLSSMEEYWERSDTNAAHPITRFISRNRFREIYRRFCTWDPTQHISSVFEKVKSWSDHIQNTSSRYWRPSSNISVDEAMIRFTGRSKDIVHLPNKPISVGYKIWAMADAGYILRWLFHSKDLGPVELLKYPGLAPTQAVVAHLLSQLPATPSSVHEYHCFVDNLFASPKLFDKLREMDIAATGTTRANRLSSKKLTALKMSEKTKDRVPWGTVYARRHKHSSYWNYTSKQAQQQEAHSLKNVGEKQKIVSPGAPSMPEGINKRM